MSGMRIVRSLPLCFLVGLVFLAEVSALAVTLDVTPGFSGAMKGGVWTPITVRLSNTDAATIDGYLIVKQGNGDAWSVSTDAPRISLPQNSRKVYHIYAMLSDFGDVTVSLVSHNRVIASKRISGNMSSKDSMMIVSIGDSSSRLSWLSGEMVPGSGARGSGSKVSIVAGSMMPDELPDRPAAYQGANVIVASDISQSSVAPKSLKALSMWVASGGTLVVSGSANYRSYQNEFYDELLPVSITGVTSLHGSTALGRLGGTPFPSTEMAVVSSVPKPGICTLCEYEGSTPVCAGRGYGLGRVIFLSADYRCPQFRDWAGQTNFWKSIISLPPVGRVAKSGLEEEQGTPGMPSWMNMNQSPSLSRAVQQNPSIAIPSYGTVTGFLFLYLLILSPINYAVLKRKRRLEWAWITVPSIILLFTVGAYGIGYTMKGGSLDLSEGTLIEGSTNCRFASALTCGSLFSPARRSYSMENGDTFGMIRAANPEGYNQSQAQPEIYQDETTNIDGISMAMWTSKSFECRSGIDLGGKLESSLVMNGDALTGEIKNDTAFDLTDCEVVMGTSRSNIGDLHPGASAKVSFQCHSASGNSAAGPGGYMSPFGSGYPGNQGVPDTPVPERIHTFVLDTEGKTATPMLIGKATVKHPGFSLVKCGGSVESLAYCSFRLDCTIGSTTSSMELPATTANVVESEKANAGPRFGGNSVLTEYIAEKGGFFTVSYNVPTMQGSTVSQLTVHVDSATSHSRRSGSYAMPSAQTSSVVITVYNFVNGTWDKVSSGSPISDAARYVNGNGNLRVKFTQTAEGFVEVTPTATVQLTRK